MNSKIIYKADPKSVTISLILTAVGVVALFIPSIVLPEGGTLSSIIVFAALILLCVGVVRVLFFRKMKIFSETGSRIKSYTYYFKQDEYSLLSTSLTKGEFSKIPTLERAPSTGIRLDVSVSVDGRFACCQIFRYIPYNFVADSDVMYVNENDLEEFISFVKQMND